MSALSGSKAAGCHGQPRPDRSAALTELVGNSSSTRQEHRRLPLFVCRAQQFFVNKSFSICCLWSPDFQNHEVIIFHNFVQLHSCFLERFTDLLILPSPEVLSHLSTFKMACSLAEVPLNKEPFYRSFVPFWYKFWVSGNQNSCSAYRLVCPPF